MSVVPVGLAARHEEHDVEHVEGPDRAQDHGRQERRAEERQRDEAEALPARRAVDLGGLQHVLRDRRERAEDDDHHEGEAEPHVGREVRGEGGREVREPRHGLGAERARGCAFMAPNCRWNIPFQASAVTYDGTAHGKMRSTR